ncbi:MAG: RNA polymerase sigma factor RpoD/SigA [Isosphaeraceae bacterium]
MSCIQAKECGVPTSLQLYLMEIKDDALLSATEECDLAEAIARGDRDARTRMIQANLRLVVKIARDYVGRGIVLDDLIGEGNLGLIRAAEEFDPRFGTRFSTYASYWIKQAIRHALINTTSTIRLPAHMVGLLTKWRRTERALSREAGRAPSFDEIAAALRLTEAQKVLVSRAHQARQLKLEGGMTGDSGHWSPDDALDRHATADSLLEADDERDILLRRLDRLDARERTILSLRYGLEGELPLTLKEIGRRLGVTREWVRKIELRAVRKLDDRAEPTQDGSSRATHRGRASAADPTPAARARAASTKARPGLRRRPIPLRSALAAAPGR